MIEDSVFDVLRKVDVSAFTEKKGKFSYLSWADAVHQLLLHYPDAVIDVKRFNGLPMIIMPDETCMVEVGVTINGVEKIELLPVINQNKPIKNPNSFQINTAIKRCLAKAISMHGLGLYIYRGEDFPDANEELQFELRELLQTNGKYNDEAELYLSSLSTKQLAEAIARNKG